MREYIDAFRDLGEVVDVAPEVDWNLKQTTIIPRRCAPDAPLPLFNKITGIKQGFRVLGAAV